MAVFPWGEYRPDVADYKGSHCKRADNVVPRADGFGPIADLVAYTTALPTACRGFFVALASDGSIEIFAGTGTKLYKLNKTTLAWENVSKTAGAHNYSLAATDQWQAAQFGNHIIFVQQNTVPQVYTLGSSTNFADLAGSPPQARYITVVNEFVVLSGLLSNPFRIHWSARSDVTGWTAGTDESDFQDFADGGIVRGVAGGEFGVVFQDKAIRRFTYAPGSPVIFSIDRIAEDEGLRAPLSIIRSGGQVFFLSNSGFQQIMAGGPPIPIGREKVDRTFFSEWDSSQPQLTIGVNDPSSTRVWWAYKSTQGSTGLFDKMICYDWLLKRFGRAVSISGEFIGSLAQPGQTLEGLDSTGYTLDSLPLSLDDIPAAFASEIAIAGSDHKVGFLRGSALEATLETAEGGDGAGRTFIAGCRPVSDAATVYAAVSGRQKLGADEAWSNESVVNALGVCPLRKETRHFRFRNRYPAGQTWTYTAGIEPELAPAGYR